MIVRFENGLTSKGDACNIIYTTYFSKIKSLPADVVPISICGKAPNWYAGLQYRKLAPKYDFFIEWKKTHDNDFYIRCFNEQVLGNKSAKAVYDELVALAGTENIALVCYESPEKFCHRHLVADWFCKNGIEAKEYLSDNFEGKK